MRLSAEEIAYISGLFEHGGLSIQHPKTRRGGTGIGLQFRGQEDVAEALSELIGAPGVRGGISEGNVKITKCVTGRSVVTRPNHRHRWGHAVLRELLPQLRFRTARMESKRTEAIQILQEIKERHNGV